MLGWVPIELTRIRKRSGEGEDKENASGETHTNVNTIDKIRLIAILVTVVQNKLESSVSFYMYLSIS